MPQLIAGDRTAGRFGTAQLVAVELAALAAAGAAVAGPPVAAGLGGAAAVLTGGALGRCGGRWMYEVAGARQRLRRRRRSAGAAGLATLAPDLTVRNVTERGAAIGIGQDRLGWFAALAITSPNGSVALRADWLARLLAEVPVPVSTLQAVTRQVPLAGSLDERTDCAQSYRELIGVAPVPANRELWLAARLGPGYAARAAAGRGGGVAGVHKALTAVIARASTALSAADVSHLVLSADALQRVLTVSCALLRPAPVSERWTGWRAAGHVHVGFAVRGWPVDPPPGLLEELTRVPGAAAVHTALVLRDTGSGAPGMRVLLRVAAAPERITDCVRQVHTGARRLGARLVRLNGEHAAAVYATAPTGAVHGMTPW